MTQKSQTAPLNRAMDWDSSDKYINTSQGFVRDRLNMRPNELDGGTFYNSKLKGNTLKDMALPAGTNKCIGWCNDYKNETLIWFVFNSNGDHSILRYFIKTGIIQKIWYAEPDLELENSNLDAVVVEGRIYWVNGSAQPKSFNIERAARHTNTLGGDSYSIEYAPFKDVVFPMIKRPPKFDAYPYYFSLMFDENGIPISFNNLRGKLFQFKYSYEYEDFQESAYSEISIVPLPEGDINSVGVWNDNFSKNNAISITINTGSRAVRKINVASRIAVNDNSGDFFLFKIIEKYDKDGIQIVPDNAAYAVTFLNNSSIKNINTEINNRYCDDVPLSANGLELIGGKWLSMSNPVKGYDNIDSDITLIPEASEIKVENATITMRSVVLGNTSSESIFGVVFAETFGFNGYPVNNCVYSFTVVFGDNTKITANYSVGESFVSGVDIRNSIFNNLASDPRMTLTKWESISSYITGDIIKIKVKKPHGQASDIKSYSATISAGSIPSYSSFKKAQYHKIGLMYSDAFGRYNVVNNEMSVYVPYFSDVEFLNKAKIAFEIKHRPPMWAETYRWVYAPKTSYTYFQDIVDVDRIAGGVDNIPGGFTFFKINQALQKLRDTNSKIITPNYIWVKGDRLRLITGIDLDKSYEITGEFIRNYDVLGEDTKEVGFLIDGEVPAGNQIEVFRPNFEFFGDIFYETGDSHEILNPHTEQRCHSGNVVNQTEDLVVSASGYLEFGDVYIRQATSEFGTLLVESSMYNDFYRSDAINIGRAAIKLQSKQKTLNAVVRSENYLQDTEYNLLHVWLPQTAYFTPSERDGAIMAIVEVGDVLKVIQEHREISVYVGKIQAKQADGSSILLDSSQVFGTDNRYAQLQGTTYPHSVASNDRYLYYFDCITGDLIRSAANGQASISKEYRMKSYFKEKAKRLRESSNFTDVIISCDNSYEEVLITFVDGSFSETIVFYEREDLKGFTYRAQICGANSAPDLLAWHGDQLFSFLNGKLYINNSGNPNEFFGSTKDAAIRFIANAPGEDTARFSDIEMSSPDNVWDVQFDIEAGLNYPVQKSILKPSIISKKDNRLYSEVLRNILGRNGVTDINKLRSGQKMNGESMSVLISNSGSGNYILREVEVKFLINK